MPPLLQLNPESAPALICYQIIAILYLPFSFIFCLLFIFLFCASKPLCLFNHRSLMKSCNSLKTIFLKGMFFMPYVGLGTFQLFLTRSILERGPSARSFRLCRDYILTVSEASKSLTIFISNEFTGFKENVVYFLQTNLWNSVKSFVKNENDVFLKKKRYIF